MHTKKGDGGISMWLVTTIILLVVLVILLTSYPTLAQGLFERVGGAMDKAILNIKFWGEEERPRECFTQQLTEVTGGKELLNETNTNPNLWDKANYTICSGTATKRANCSVWIENKRYTLDSEGFSVGDNVCSTTIKPEEITNLIFYRTLLNKFVSEWEVDANEWKEKTTQKGLTNYPTRNELEERYMTDTFVLYSEPEGRNEELTLIWASGHWILEGKNGKTNWIGTNDDEALQRFYKEVSSGDADRVHYTILQKQEPRKIFNPTRARALAILTKKPIKDIAGHHGYNALVAGYESDQLDHEKELTELQTWFRKFKRGQILGRDATYETHPDELFGEGITIDNTTWNVVSGTLNDENPEITFWAKETNKEYGLDFRPTRQKTTTQHKGCTSKTTPETLSTTPFILMIRENGEWKEAGEETVYKLESNETFEAVLQNTRIHNFLWRKCG